MYQGFKMRSFLFRTLITASATLLIACSATQFTFYGPSESEPSWRVTVVKEALSENFICSINGSEVVEESFSLFANSFEKDGSYQGKIVKMSGFRTYHGGVGYSTTMYQIRVFIDEKEIGKFDF